MGRTINPRFEEILDLKPDFHWKVYVDDVFFGDMFHFHYCFPINLFLKGYYLFDPNDGIGGITTGKTKEQAWHKFLELYGFEYLKEG